MKYQTNNPTVIRFYELSALLSASSHARGGAARTTMNKLMTEYDELKNSNQSAWIEYCRIKHLPTQDNQARYY